MPDWFAPISIDGSNLSMAELVQRLVAAFFFGSLAAAIHWWTSPAIRRSDRSFLATLVMLAILVAVVTIVIGNNIARAFSLAGVLSIVRFRTVVDDTRDTAFVIYAVVAGMAVGSGYYWEPGLVTPLFLAAAWLFRAAPVGKPPSHAILVVRFFAGRPMDGRVDELMAKHLRDFHLVGLSTARGGSALDASYNIELPPADKVFALVSELARIEGVQNVEVKDV